MSQQDEWDAGRHGPRDPAVSATDVLMKVNVPGLHNPPKLSRLSRLTPTNESDQKAERGGHVSNHLCRSISLIARTSSTQVQLG